MKNKTASIDVLPILINPVDIYLSTVTRKIETYQFAKMKAKDVSQRTVFPLVRLFT